jgi:hypothetical protein
MRQRARLARAASVRLGLFAILFQAILFGWHHHDIGFARHLPAAVVENPAAAPLPADDEDGCEICQTLHHQTAANIDFVAPPPQAGIAAGLPAGNTAFIVHPCAAAFRARAPPSPDAEIG